MPTGDGESILEGEIVIINNHNQKQVLVATTRFLTKDKILFRLVSSVVIPPKSRIKAIVRSDKPLFLSEVTNGRLIIPGLRLNLQNKIYGELNALKSLEGQINKENSDRAKFLVMQNMSTRTLKKSLKNIKKELGENYLISEDTSRINFLSTDISPHLDQTTKTFKIKLKLEIIHVAIPYNEFVDFIKKRVLNDFSDVRYYGINKEEIIFKSMFLNNDEKEAKFDIVVKVLVSNKDILSLIPKEDFTRKSKEWLTRYLESLKEIKRVEIEFFPFWVTKTPSIPNNIEIIIKPVEY